MKKLGVGLFFIIGIAIVIMGGSWVFDGGGVLRHLHHQQSGGLITQYNTLSTETPRSATGDSVRSYMQEGAITDQPHIIHSQQDLMSDLFWIRNIQHIGTYVLRDKAPGLLNMMSNLSALSPRWTEPYVFAQYVGPQQIPQGSTPNDDHQHSRQETITIGENGIRMTCDSTKIARIIALDDNVFGDMMMRQGDVYRDLLYPCDDYTLPHTLAFNYYYYLHDIEKAIAYYKVAAFDPDAPRVTSIMPALLRSRQGDHLISAQLRFNRAMAFDTTTEDPVILAQHQRALHKAIRELQLHILEKVDQTADCNHDYPCLVSSHSLRTEIMSLTRTCDASPTTITCALLTLGSEGGYITSTGTLFDPSTDPLSDKWIYDKKWGWRVE